MVRRQKIPAQAYRAMTVAEKTDRTVRWVRPLSEADQGQLVSIGSRSI